MAVAELTDVMNRLERRMTEWSVRAEIMAEQHHTCQQSHLRYPWPPEKGCPGCKHEIQKWVDRLHLEMPFLLFGWDAVIDAAERAIQLKIDQAHVRRNMGAGIMKIFVWVIVVPSLVLVACLFVMLIISKFSNSTWFCIKMGWHRTPIRIGFDGASRNGECPRCGKSVMQDSQGNWF